MGKELLKLTKRRGTGAHAGPWGPPCEAARIVTANRHQAEARMQRRASANN